LTVTYGHEGVERCSGVNGDEEWMMGEGEKIYCFMGDRCIK
jgi:hypothetical protein